MKASAPVLDALVAPHANLGIACGHLLLKSQMGRMTSIPARLPGPQQSVESNKVGTLPAYREARPTNARSASLDTRLRKRGPRFQVIDGALTISISLRRRAIHHRYIRSNSHLTDAHRSLGIRRLIGRFRIGRTCGKNKQGQKGTGRANTTEAKYKIHRNSMGCLRRTHVETNPHIAKCVPRHGIAIRLRHQPQRGTFTQHYFVKFARRRLRRLASPLGVENGLDCVTQRKGEK